MWLAYPELVAGTAVLALLGLALGLRVRAVPAATLIGGTVAVALFTAHALVVVGLGRVAGLDGGVLDWFLAHRSDGATALMRAASFAGDSAATVVAVVVAVVLLWWRGRRAGAAALAVAALGSPLLSSGFKRLYRRERPPLADHLDAVSGYALPSGHALNSMVVIGVLVAACALHVRRTRTRVALVSAGAVAVAIVGVSRLYLGVHWLTDVLAGWLLGGAWVAVCVTAMVALDHRSRRPDTSVGDVEHPGLPGCSASRTGLPPQCGHGVAGRSAKADPGDAGASRSGERAGAAGGGDS